MQVMVVDDAGQQLGVLGLPEALQLAQERGLDLVEVAPTNIPPVCRILDYGRFRYMQTKKEKEARKTQKVSNLRQVRMRTRIGQHDIDSKFRQIRKLLDEGSKVRVSVLFRGREITHPDLGIRLLRRVAETLQEESKLEKPPAMEGRMLSIVLVPITQKKALAATPLQEVNSAQTQNT